MVTLCTAMALLCASVAARAAPGQDGGDRGDSRHSGGAGVRGAGRTGGWHGPVVTHPGQPEIDYPRGEVCPFATHAEFPVVDMVQRTWTNDAGDPVYAVISGPLVMDVTNKETGKTIRRDLSGTGTLVYPEPGSDTHVLSGGDWGVGLHTSDRPEHNKWLVSRGFMAVRIKEGPHGTSRELLVLEGPYEDLCKTLAR
ncbi:hypothetical protein [Streptomyces oryzae]|uniref:hypothetical protein n=1 Tax=Streptomyces oryzae TaxID=1434886 RepID=UPI001AD9EA3F|nr:hypothetical protein [Streptomyces oryzae]